LVSYSFFAVETCIRLQKYDIFRKIATKKGQKGGCFGIIFFEKALRKPVLEYSSLKFVVLAKSSVFQ
jgi:hypothetical protein